MAGFRKFCKTVGKLCGAIATSIAPFNPVIAAALAVVGIATEVTTQDRDRRQSNTQIDTEAAENIAEIEQQYIKDLAAINKHYNDYLLNITNNSEKTDAANIAEKFKNFEQKLAFLTIDEEQITAIANIINLVATGNTEQAKQIITQDRTIVEALLACCGFQIAILSGDQELYELILAEYSDLIDLNQTDHLGRTLYQYADLANEELLIDSLDRLAEHGQYSLVSQNPSNVDLMQAMISDDIAKFKAILNRGLDIWEPIAEHFIEFTITPTPESSQPSQKFGRTMPPQASYRAVLTVNDRHIEINLTNHSLQEDLEVSCGIFSTQQETCVQILKPTESLNVNKVVLTNTIEPIGVAIQNQNCYYSPILTFLDFYLANPYKITLNIDKTLIIVVQDVAVLSQLNFSQLTHGMVLTNDNTVYFIKDGKLLTINNQLKKVSHVNREPIAKITNSNNCNIIDMNNLPLEQEQLITPYVVKILQRAGIFKINLPDNLVLSNNKTTMLKYAISNDISLAEKFIIGNRTAANSELHQFIRLGQQLAGLGLGYKNALGKLILNIDQHNLAIENYQQLVEDLLSTGQDINQIVGGMTPIMLAIQNRDEWLINKLLDNGAKGWQLELLKNFHVPRKIPQEINKLQLATRSMALWHNNQVPAEVIKLPVFTGIYIHGAANNMVFNEIDLPLLARFFQVDIELKNSEQDSTVIYLANRKATYHIPKVIIQLLNGNYYLQQPDVTPLLAKQELNQSIRKTTFTNKLQKYTNLPSSGKSCVGMVVDNYRDLLANHAPQDIGTDLLALLVQAKYALSNRPLTSKSQLIKYIRLARKNYAKFINQLDWRDSGIHNVIINKVSAITSDSLLQQQLAGLREDLSIYNNIQRAYQHRQRSMQQLQQDKDQAIEAVRTKQANLKTYYKKQRKQQQRYGFGISYNSNGNQSGWVGYGSWNDAKIPVMSGNTRPSFARDNPEPAWAGVGVRYRPAPRDIPDLDNLDDDEIVELTDLPRVDLAAFSDFSNNTNTGKGYNELFFGSKFGYPDNNFAISQSENNISDNFTNAARFTIGASRGAVINTFISQAIKLPYLGSVLNATSSYLAGSALVTYLNKKAIDFEHNNFLGSDDYREIMQNPLFTQEQKQKIHEEAILRQEKYLKIRQNIKNPIHVIKDYITSEWHNNPDRLGENLVLFSGIAKWKKFNLFNQSKLIQSPELVAIHRGWKELSGRQALLLEKMSKSGSRITINKSDINVTDLAALTAKTGDEFAMFTLGGKRIIIRGSDQEVRLLPALFNKFKSEGWTWSAHTHPGDLAIHTLPSGFPGDRQVLALLDQDQSLILNSLGRKRVFGKSGLIDFEISREARKIVSYEIN